MSKLQLRLARWCEGLATTKDEGEPATRLGTQSSHAWCLTIFCLIFAWRCSQPRNQTTRSNARDPNESVRRVSPHHRRRTPEVHLIPAFSPVDRQLSRRSRIWRLHKDDLFSPKVLCLPVPKTRSVSRPRRSRLPGTLTDGDSTRPSCPGVRGLHQHALLNMASFHLQEEEYPACRRVRSAIVTRPVQPILTSRFPL